MLTATAHFVTSMKKGGSPHWLSFAGPSGLGKTMLAKRVWKWFNDLGKFYEHGSGAQLVRSGRLAYWPQVLQRLREGCYGITSELGREWLLVLDDIGAERDPTGFSADSLNTLLNTRLGKWTVITCNLSLKDIADKVDYRIASRMMRDGNIVVNADTLDYALRP